MTDQYDVDYEVPVREATREDLPDIRDLLGATWHDTYDAIYGSERVADITSRWHSIAALTQYLEQPDGYFVVAEVNGAIVGTAYARIDSEDTLHLFGLYVQPRLQGRGIGQALLEHVKDAFPDARTLRLEVEPANAVAIRFYERNDFQVVGSGDDCCGQGEGIVHSIMERRLG